VPNSEAARRVRANVLLAGLLALCLLSAAACGRLNRTVTLDSAATRAAIGGAAVAAALERQLAGQGLAAATVTCAHSIVVNVGATSACILHRGGANKTVRFTFRSSGGEIAPGSVKAY
jgi:hypothetical protein